MSKDTIQHKQQQQQRVERIGSEELDITVHSDTRTKVLFITARINSYLHKQ